MANKLKVNDLLLDVWLLEQLRKAPEPGLTLDELRARWTSNPSHEGVLSRSTMTRHRKMITDFFHVNIDCPDKKHYHISNSESLSLDSLANDLLASLQEYLFLDEFQDLGNAIMPQQIWEGLEYLRPIGEAIRERKKLRITYQKFTDDTPYEAIVHPYCLKASQGRWYLLAEKENSSHPVQTFALDRTHSLHKMEESYAVNPQIDIDTYFTNAFGVWVEEDKYPVKDIIVSVGEKPAQYFRTLPLHHSQKIVGHEGENTLFQFHIGMTPDFIGELKRWDVKKDDIHTL